MSTITGKVVALKRSTTSRNGNPAFMVSIQQEDGAVTTHRTVTDAMIAYGIENPEYRECLHKFTLNRTGHIEYAHHI